MCSRKRSCAAIRDCGRLESGETGKGCGSAGRDQAASLGGVIYAQEGKTARAYLVA